jgi:hypothetical protein
MAQKNIRKNTTSKKTSGGAVGRKIVANKKTATAKQELYYPSENIIMPKGKRITHIIDTKNKEYATAKIIGDVKSWNIEAIWTIFIEAANFDIFHISHKHAQQLIDNGYFDRCRFNYKDLRLAEEHFVKNVMKTSPIPDHNANQESWTQAMKWLNCIDSYHQLLSIWLLAMGAQQAHIGKYLKTDRQNVKNHAADVLENLEREIRRGNIIPDIEPPVLTEIEILSVKEIQSQLAEMKKHGLFGNPKSKKRTSCLNI